VQRVYIGRYGPNQGNYYARGNVYNALLHKYDPRSLIENAEGGSGSDTLTGNIAANQLSGNGGSDTLTGGVGDDILDGGANADTAVFSGSRSNYTIVTNADGSIIVADTRQNGDGKDTLVSINFAKFSDQLVTVVDPGLTLHGTGQNDTLMGDAWADQLYGLGGNDRLNGLDSSDLMSGGTGSDILNGGLGNDVLTGGKGKDKFVFDTALSKAKNLDTIQDFSVKDDMIQLENTIFKKLGTKTGTPMSSFFTIGAKAKEKDDYIVYNQKTGALSYDADGSGKGKAVEFAKLKPGLKLTHHDFIVI
jgi:serralysin